MALRCLLLATVCGCGWLFGCCHCSRPAEPKHASAPQYPVIVRLVSRAHTITVSAGPAAPLYSAQSADGKAIASNLTLEQLQDRHPALYQRLIPVVAVDASVLVTAR